MAYSEYWWRGFCVAALVFAWRGVALAKGATRVAAGFLRERHPRWIVRTETIRRYEPSS